MSSVREETVGPIRIVTMSNEGKLNAFDIPMLQGIVAAVQRADADPAVRIIVLTGEGRAFSTGGDVTTMGDVPDAYANHRHLTEQIHAVPRALRSARLLTIGMINGVAVGAGLDIALACDLRTCSTGAHLAEGYINAGLAAGDGGAWLLPRLVGAGRALELLVSGRRIPPEEALAIGLVNRLSPAETLRDDTLEFAGELAAKPANATAAMKRLVQQSVEAGYDLGMQLAGSAVPLLQTGDEHRQAVAALLNRPRKD